MGKKGGKFKKKQTMRSKFAENAAEIEVNDERYKASAAERWERRKDLDGSGDESGEEGEEGKEGGEGGGGQRAPRPAQHGWPSGPLSSPAQEQPSHPTRQKSQRKSRSLGKIGL